MPKHNSQGFTLVEISIVIVIIALITAGVLAGQNIFKQASLIQVTKEYAKYKSAIQTFKGQYNYFPGDMPNAFEIWGTNCGSSVAHCNGNGNGLVDWNTGISAIDNEIARIWQHMSLAKVIPESYSTNLSAGGYVVAGISVPKTSYKPSNGQQNAAWSSDIGHGKLVLSGIMEGTTCHECYIFAGSDAVSPRDAYNIDYKADDGIASTGDIITTAGKTRASNFVDWSTTCTDAADSSGYMRSNNGPGCRMSFAY